MLTVVRSPSGGQEGGRPPRKLPVLSLLPAEAARLRATLRNLRRAYGGWDVLASVMGVYRKTIEKIARGAAPGSPGMLLRAARAAGVSVERLLAPLSSADVCPTCGARRAP
ncbi:transcriptional regulator [Polyangium fumosum]|uniref:Transcriptional regulator n=1 Tax=Polyangium fumosum TaxID=889272 RepID=A0A4U1JGJ9_9BACT|nr:transcriptional regulator [Polyangium fumosum]TKD10457.1 transcriptional regulator [Polyangium fumosum]